MFFEPPKSLKNPRETLIYGHFIYTLSINNKKNKMVMLFHRPIKYIYVWVCYLITAYKLLAIY